MHKSLLFIVFIAAQVAKVHAAEVDLVYKPAPVEMVVRTNIAYKTTPSGPLTADIYLPAKASSEHRWPVVLFILGDASPETLKNAKDWLFIKSYGASAVAEGFCGVAFNHRSSENSSKLRDVRDDITSAIDFVRQNSLKLPIDTNRLNLWFFSGSGVHLPAAMGDRTAGMRSIVAYYPVLEPPPFFQLAIREKFSALAQLKIHAPKIPPLLLVKAGKDYPDWNAHIDQFRAEAERLKVRLEFLAHPNGRHAFDLFNNDDVSKDIIQRSWQFLRKANETPIPAGP